MVFFIMSLVLISYLAIKKRYGLNQSLLSIALLVTFPPLYGNGKSVLGEVPGLFWMMFFLWSLEKWKSTASKHKVYAIATGVSAGLCVTTKPIFLLLIPAIVITAVARRHKIPHKLKWVSFAVISFLLPVGFWVFTQFSGNDSLSDILGFYANPYQIKNIAQIIISNLKPFITQIGPFSLLLMMTVWLLALLIRLKKKINIATEELIAIIFSSLIILAFLRTTGSYRYLFPAQIISLLYFPHLYLSSQKS